MRYTKDHKIDTRRRLVEHASARFRKDGLNAVGLRALVADAGVTHGAFYSHFESRAHLIAEAVKSGCDDNVRALQHFIAKADGNGLQVFVDQYLSEGHVKGPMHGCVFSALLPEVARETGEARADMIRGAITIADVLATQLPVGGEPVQRSGRARAIFAGMMGTLQFARAIDDDAMRESVLEQGRKSAMILANQPWG